ncbi:MAG TPA: T9SS type A sorting domain-containing protein [Flavipsychrobacter sp.]
MKRAFTIIKYAMILLIGLTGNISIAQTPQYYVGPTTVNGYLYPWGVTTAGGTGERVQFIYLPSDFNAPLPKGFITSVWFRPYNGSSIYNGAFTMNNLKVSIGHTTLTAHPGGSWQTGLTQVYGPNAFYINWTQGVWFEIVLSTPFYYDGTSNLIVELFNNSSTASPKYAEFDNASTQRIAYGTQTSVFGTNNYRYNFGVNIFPGYPCTDTPKTSIYQPKKVCPNKPFTIAPDSSYSDADYQWEYSNNGVSWANHTATVGLYGDIKDSITADKWYRVTIKCKANQNLKWTSPPHKVEIAPFYYCYCDNKVTVDAGADIGNLTIIKTGLFDSVYKKSLLVTGTGIPTYNNSSAGRSYTSYHDSLGWPCLYRDTTYLFNITQIHSGGSFEKGVVQAYIDYNRDGLYNPNTERIFVQAMNGLNANPHIVQVTGKVPSNAQIGPTGMRVIISKDTVKGAPCDTISGGGEVEDYIVEICHRPCTGPVNAGLVVSTDTSMCAGYEYTLTDTTYERSQSGFLRAWQVSGDNSTWFNIPNSQNKDTLERIFAGQPMYYRLRTICASTHDTNYSAGTLINVKPGYKCYCYSKAVGGLNVDTSDIGGVTIADYSSNAGGPHLLNAAAVKPRTDFTDITPINLFIDSVYEFSVFHTMPVVEHGDAKVTIFMDFNNNHKYDIPAERIYTGYTTIGSHTLIDNVIIPQKAITDVPTGMRVIINNDVGPNVPSDSACGPYTSGETEDYVLIFRKAWPAGINGQSVLTGFDVHPNPTSGKFHIQFNTQADVKGVQVRVMNVTGQVVLEKIYEYKGGMLYQELDMTGQPSGVYSVELQTEGQKLMKKLIVQ